jgi:hypothetical protein
VIEIPDHVIDAAVAAYDEAGEGDVDLREAIESGLRHAFEVMGLKEERTNIVSDHAGIKRRYVTDWQPVKGPKR